MNIWTTYTPRKVHWELSYFKTKGESPSSNWLKNINLINNSLKKLKRAGISGIRLVIYPNEVTEDGKIFNWAAIDQMLILCSKNSLEVDLCIGPFQYPNYPGIYLPQKLIKYIRNDSRYIDDNPIFSEYGENFLKEQLKRYGKDSRVRGFHLGNEWPDMQAIEGLKGIKLTVSEKFMLNSVAVIKNFTSKPILLNTNIDVSNRKEFLHIFANLLIHLGQQGRMGFDIYPSQEKWTKVPFRKIKRMFWSYQHSLNSIQKDFPICTFYFTEVEAQPWGGGQSWYQLINQEPDPNQKVLLYSKDSLKETFDKHIRGTNCSEISLWGSDFWLVAYEMGIKWPLNSISSLGK